MNFLIRLKRKTKVLIIKENIYYLLFITVIFLLDRFSKLKIIDNFNDATYYVNDYININLIWNIGIGFGLLSTETNLFYNLVTVLIGIVVLILFYTSVLSESLDKFIYSFIIGGALGNFYDRLTFKAVPDFIDLHYNNFHWFTFNVADIFISLGIAVFICKSIFIKN